MTTGKSLVFSYIYHFDKNLHNNIIDYNKSSPYQPKRAHVTPLLIELHWLPVAARIRFKSLMLAYRVLAGSAPMHLPKCSCKGKCYTQDAALV